MSRSDIVRDFVSAIRGAGSAPRCFWTAPRLAAFLLAGLGVSAGCRTASPPVMVGSAVEPELPESAQVPPPKDSIPGRAIAGPALAPVVVTEPVKHDTDDP